MMMMVIIIVVVIIMTTFVVQSSWDSRPANASDFSRSLSLLRLILRLYDLE